MRRPGDGNGPKGGMAIEPIFGHLEQDHRLRCHYLKETEDDQINALLAGCGFNLRKLSQSFLLSPFQRALWRSLLGHQEPLANPLKRLLRRKSRFSGITNYPGRQGKNVYPDSCDGRQLRSYVVMARACSERLYACNHITIVW